MSLLKPKNLCYLIPLYPENLALKSFCCGFTKNDYLKMVDGFFFLEDKDS